MENVGEVGGLANPDRRCTRRRNAPPVCAIMQIRQGWNNRNEFYERLEPCANCVRAERNRLAAHRARQRQRAFTRSLRAENVVLNANHDWVSRIHQEVLTEQEKLKDLLAAAQVARSYMEEIRKAEN